MGFNTVNFIVNTINTLTFAASSGSNAQSGDAVENSAASSVKTDTNQTNSNSSAGVSSNTYSNVSSGQNIISTLEVEQQANYIKDLLNLPRDFQDLINQIQAGGQNAQQLADLNMLLQDGKINLAALSIILSENSKAASKKLLNTIMEVSKLGADITQLKQLMGMLSASSGQTDSIQTIKNLLMLYLPWLPLSVRNNLNLELEIAIFDKIKKNNTQQSEKTEIIKILIETVNYGNVLGELQLNSNNEAEVFISAVETFPREPVLRAFKEQDKKSGANTNILIEKNKAPKKSEHFQKNVQIVSSNYVSSKLIILAHFLIKTVIDIDLNQNIINTESEN